MDVTPRKDGKLRYIYIYIYAYIYIINMSVIFLAVIVTRNMGLMAKEIVKI